jgi:hypothetical protein
MVPSPSERLSYAECLRLEGLRFQERAQGRSGQLSPAEEAEHRRHSLAICKALAAGVEFDRLVFG